MSICGFDILQEDPHCQAALGFSFPWVLLVFLSCMLQDGVMFFLVLANYCFWCFHQTCLNWPFQHTKISSCFQTMGRRDVILGTGFSCSTMEETVDILKNGHFCNRYEDCNTQFYHLRIFIMMQLQIETCFIFSVLDYSAEKR